MRLPRRVSSRRSSAASQRIAVLTTALAKVSPKRRETLLRMATRQPVVLRVMKPKASTDQSTVDLQLPLWAVDEYDDNGHDTSV